MSKYTKSLQIIKELKIQKINIFSNLQNQIGGAGFMFAILAAAFSALPNVIPKQLMDEYSANNSIIPNPLMIVFVIYVVNSLLFSPISKLNKKNRTKNSTEKNTESNTKAKRMTLMLLVLLGVVEASGTLSYTIGLQETSATNASILVNSETVFAILLGIMIFKEKLSKREVFPLILIVVGSMLIPIAGDIQNNNWQFSDFRTGDLFILLSGFFYCLDTFIAKKISDSIKTRQIVHVMSCTGAILTLILMLLFEIPFDISLEDLSIMSLVGFLGIGVTMVFFVMTLRLIGAVRTVLIYSTTTIFSIVYSTFILLENITILNMISVGMCYLA